MHVVQLFSFGFDYGPRVIPIEALTYWKLVPVKPEKDEEAPKKEKEQVDLIMPSLEIQLVLNIRCRYSSIVMHPKLMCTILLYNCSCLLDLVTYVNSPEK